MKNLLSAALVLLATHAAHARTVAVRPAAAPAPVPALTAPVTGALASPAVSALAPAHLNAAALPVAPNPTAPSVAAVMAPPVAALPSPAVAAPEASRGIEALAGPDAPIEAGFHERRGMLGGAVVPAFRSDERSAALVSRHRGEAEAAFETRRDEDAPRAASSMTRPLSRASSLARRSAKVAGVAAALTLSAAPAVAGDGWYGVSMFGAFGVLYTLLFIACDALLKLDMSFVLGRPGQAPLRHRIGWKVGEVYIGLLERVVGRLAVSAAIGVGSALLLTQLGAVAGFAFTPLQALPVVIAWAVSGFSLVAAKKINAAMVGAALGMTLVSPLIAALVSRGVLLPGLTPMAVLAAPAAVLGALLGERHYAHFFTSLYGAARGLLRGLVWPRYAYPVWAVAAIILMVYGPLTWGQTAAVLAAPAALLGAVRAVQGYRTEPKESGRAYLEARQKASIHYRAP